MFEYDLGYSLAAYSLGDLGYHDIPERPIYARDLRAEEYFTFIPLAHQLQIWIAQPIEGYLVCLFSTIDFLEGFRAGCDTQGVDFRDRILGLPMRREADAIVYYVWRGFDFKQPQPPISAVAREGLYHIENYEDHAERPTSANEPI